MGKDEDGPTDKHGMRFWLDKKKHSFKYEIGNQR